MVCNFIPFIKTCCISVFGERFYLTKQCGPNEMPHYTAFNQGVHVLSKLSGLQGLNSNRHWVNTTLVYRSLQSLCDLSKWAQSAIFMFTLKGPPYNLQQTAISNFSAFSKITNKA